MVDGLGEILLRLRLIEENVGVLPEFKRLVVVFHTEIIAVDSQVLQHVQRLGMRVLQLLVHAERLSELAFLLIEFALYVEQRRVLWLERESLGDKVLQPFVVVVVDTEVHRRRDEVVVGRIILRGLLQRDDGQVVLVGGGTRLDEVDEHRLAVFVLARPDVGLQVGNGLPILSLVDQAGCSVVGQLRIGRLRPIASVGKGRQVGHIDKGARKLHGVACAHTATVEGRGIGQEREDMRHIIGRLAIFGTRLLRSSHDDVGCSIATIQCVVGQNLVCVLVGQPHKLLIRRIGIHYRLGSQPTARR